MVIIDGLNVGRAHGSVGWKSPLVPAAEISASGPLWKKPICGQAILQSVNDVMAKGHDVKVFLPQWVRAGGRPAPRPPFAAPPDAPDTSLRAGGRRWSRHRGQARQTGERTASTT